MSLNRYAPHLVVLPEDDANREIAVGFFNDEPLSCTNHQILRSAKGWPGVRDSFGSGHNHAMRQTPQRRMILLVDFDDAKFRDVKVEDRIAVVTAFVDRSIRDRVFVLGARSEPERLRKDLGGYEKIGKLLAKDCAEGTRVTWEHPLLAHNRIELDRMMPSIRPILFG